MDDPWFMSEIAQFQVEQLQSDATQTKKMGKEKQIQMINAVGRLMDVSLMPIFLLYTANSCLHVFIITKSF